MHSSSQSILCSIRSRLSCSSIFHHEGGVRLTDRDLFAPPLATRLPMTVTRGLPLRIPARHRSFCQVFLGLCADCLLEMNRPFPESRKIVFSGFLVILFSFRFERPDGRIAAKRRKIVARGERSEPLVAICIIKSPGRAKEVDQYFFRPFRAPSTPFFTRGSLCSPLATGFRASGAGRV
jgi:hypothetical protein